MGPMLAPWTLLSGLFHFSLNEAVFTFPWVMDQSTILGLACNNIAHPIEIRLELKILFVHVVCRRNLLPFCTGLFQNFRGIHRMKWMFAYDVLQGITLVGFGRIGFMAKCSNNWCVTIGRIPLPSLALKLWYHWEMCTLWLVFWKNE